MKKIFTLFFCLSVTFVYGAAIEIKTDCLYLDELVGEKYPHVSLTCGFNPGDTKRISSSMVASSLRRGALDIPENMPDVYVVTRVGHKLEYDTVLNHITELYEKEYADKTVYVESLRISRDITLSDDLDYTIDINTGRIGNVSGSIVLGHTKVSFNCTVKLFQYAFVADSMITKGENITGKAEFKMVDVSNLRSLPVSDIKDLEAVRNITKNSIITSDLVKEKADRKKGDKVIIIYNSGNLYIEVNGIAEGDAVVGKIIQVKNPDSGKIVSAEYIGGGKAIAQ